MSDLTYIECCEKYRQQIIDRVEPAKKSEDFLKMGAKSTST